MFVLLYPISVHVCRREVSCGERSPETGRSICLSKHERVFMFSNLQNITSRCSWFLSANHSKNNHKLHLSCYICCTFSAMRAICDEHIQNKIITHIWTRYVMYTHFVHVAHISRDSSTHPPHAFSILCDMVILCEFADVFCAFFILFWTPKHFVAHVFLLS